MSPTDRPHTRLAALLLSLFFLVLLLQAHSSTLLAAQNASGWFSLHCDGASFYLSKVDGLSSGQKLNLTMRHYALSWWKYRPQEVWEDRHAELCFSVGKCEAATHARIWLDKGDAKDKRVSGKYDVDFGGQHLEGNSWLNIESKIGFVNELAGVPVNVLPETDPLQAALSANFRAVAQIPTNRPTKSRRVSVYV